MTGGGAAATARSRLTRRLTLVLAVCYLVLGVAETVRLTISGDGGLVFWFGTLVGGGALLLVGGVPRTAAPGPGRRACVVLGALLGTVATSWTLVLPVLAIAVLVRTITGAPQ